MYSSGVDVIYQAAGNSGNGVFSEANDFNDADESKKLWVIGVEPWSNDEGKYDTR